MNKFKQWRESSGLSQNDVAEKLGFETPQMISNIERNISCYPIGSINKVASIFSVTPKEIKEEIFKFKVDKIREKLGL